MSQREALKQRVYDLYDGGYSYKQVGMAVGLSYNAVAGILYRRDHDVRARLKKLEKGARHVELQLRLMRDEMKKTVGVAKIDLTVVNRWIDALSEGLDTHE